MQESTGNILKGMEPVSLAELDNVKLMNRMDTKCVFSVGLLNHILQQCAQDYRVLFHANTNAAYYKTLYFDTPELQFYKDHHNGREKRYKVRIRNYTESDLFFLEIKYKRYGRTDKKRIRTEGFTEELNAQQNDFLGGVAQTHFNLSPVMWNNFHRITLMSKNTPERVTIDTNLSFEYNGMNAGFQHLVIGEIKQEKSNHRSPILNLLKKNGIRPSGMSKYCLGMALLNNKVKRNNFKERILAIEKITI